MQHTSFRVQCNRRLIGCQLHLDGTVQESGEGPTPVFSFTAIMGIERDAQVIINIARDNLVYRHLIETDYETARGLTIVLQLIIGKAVSVIQEKHPLQPRSKRFDPTKSRETYGMDIVYVTDGPQADHYLAVMRQCLPRDPRTNRPVTPEA